MELAPRRRFAALDSIPESPFRVKGVLYQGTREFFEKHVEGGFEALRETLGPGALRDFLDQRFLASSWYEVIHVPHLIAAEAATMRMSERAYLRMRTEHQVEADMGGAYKILLRVASPELIVPRLPKIMTQMFNFGVPSVEFTEPQRFKMRLEGVPAALGAWLETALEIYVEHAIAATGARDPFVAMEAPDVMDRRDGFPTLALSMRGEWR